MFAMSRVAPNAARYLTWGGSRHAGMAAGAGRTVPVAGVVDGLLVTLAIVNIACYLPYTVFNDWWYLRFLLPAIAALLILTVAVVDALIRRMALRTGLPYGTESSAGRPVPRRLILSVFTVALCVLFVREARARSVFDLHRLESRYERAGTYVANRLPSNAFVITSWESGSVRFYSNRKTLAWDALDPAWLDRAIAYARARGYEPYLLFERWEEPLSAAFRRNGHRGARLAARSRNRRPGADLPAGGRERYVRGDGVPPSTCDDLLFPKCVRERIAPIPPKALARNLDARRRLAAACIPPRTAALHPYHRLASEAARHDLRHAQLLFDKTIEDRVELFVRRQRILVVWLGRSSAVAPL